ncbi:unnamed protein product [Ectocarpus sp. 6 AP-2014]
MFTITSSTLPPVEGDRDDGNAPHPLFSPIPRTTSGIISRSCSHVTRPDTSSGIYAPMTSSLQATSPGAITLPFGGREKVPRKPLHAYRTRQGKREKAKRLEDGNNSRWRPCARSPA